MPDTRNRQWRVARYPEPAELIGAEHFEWTEADIPAPGPGEFLVKTICLAPGPAMRGYLETRQSGFYGAQISLGEVMRGRGVGVIVESSHPDYKAGDIFVGSLGWQEYSIQQPDAGEFIFSTRIIDKPVRPLTLHMGILGQAGGTAYFGLHEAGGIKAGDNVLVSAAAGGVGSVAGQIARIRGAATVVGLTSTTDKCAWLCDELGYSAAINYVEEDLDRRLTELFPDGIDVYVDNVGGEILDTALMHLAMHARVALIGFISTQYADRVPTGPANYTQILFKRARMQGSIYFDYWDRYAEAEADLTRWYRDGSLVNCESIDEGLEKMPESLASLFTGANRGIKICRVAPDP